MKVGVVIAVCVAGPHASAAGAFAPSALRPSRALPGVRLCRAEGINGCAVSVFLAGRESGQGSGKSVQGVSGSQPLQVRRSCAASMLVTFWYVHWLGYVNVAEDIQSVIDYADRVHSSARALRRSGQQQLRARPFDAVNARACVDARGAGTRQHCWEERKQSIAPRLNGEKVNVRIGAPGAHSRQLNETECRPCPEVSIGRGHLDMPRAPCSCKICTCKEKDLAPEVHHTEFAVKLAVAHKLGALFQAAGSISLKL